jgi:hypothetical protein
MNKNIQVSLQVDALQFKESLSRAKSAINKRRTFERYIREEYNPSGCRRGCLLVAIYLIVLTSLLIIFI